MDHAGADHSPLVRAWQAALLALTPIRRVVVPRSHPDFCFDSDEVSHGARLWTNLMGLMCAHAWMEQRNREVVALDGRGQAIVATAEDYEAAYRLFAATCERSVVNISDTHRKILDALYVMQKEQERDAGRWNDPREAYKPFSQRRIAKASGVPQSTVSDNKSYLLHSLKFLEERHDGRLRLVRDADPSWWDGSDALDGFPMPERVRGCWRGEDGGEHEEGAAENYGEDPFTFS